jgi:hypothetical protein
MRVTLLSSVSAIGLLALAGPAMADTTFTGVGQLYVGGGYTDGSFFVGKALDDPFTFGGNAKGYWPLSPDVHLQVDLFAEHSDDVTRNWGDEDDTTTFGAAAHLLHPFESRARLGVAGSVWSSDVFVPADTGQKDADYGLLAVEGQFFGTDWTATGQAGIFSKFSCDDGGEGCPLVVDDGSFVRGKIRYFLNDNTSLSVEAMQMWGSLDDTYFGGKSLTTASSTWRLEGEHKLSDSPFAGSIALTHEHTSADVYLSGNADTTSVLFSV